MIRNFLIIAWRNIQRNKVYSFINIAGLGLGLACCMLILLYIKDEVSFDRFHEQAQTIYRITNYRTSPDGKEAGRNGITGMMPGPAFKAAIPEVKAFVRVQGEQLPVKVGQEIFEQEATYVDENFFNVFSFTLLEGSKQALKDMYAVVLSEATAKKFFGTAAAMGQTLAMPTGKDGAFENFTVAAIVPNSPQNSTIKIAMLMSMNLNLREGRVDNQWINFYLNTFVVLHPDAHLAKVEEKFNSIYQQNAAGQIKEAREKYGMNEQIHYGLQPLTDIHLSTLYGAENGLVDGSNPMYTKILGAIALFLLLIACINFVNLSVARSLKRAREIGVRKVIGGQRKELIFQFLAESSLLSFLSFVLAVLLVLLVLPLFNTLANKALSFTYLLDAKLVLGYVGLFIFTTLLAGFYPALVLSAFNPVQTLYNRMPLSGRNYLSKGLVVLQFTLTSFLIIATITLYAQFNYLNSFNLGYNDKNLVLVATERMKAPKVALLRNELMKSKSVEAVAVRQRGQWETVAKVDGKDMEFHMDVADSNYFSVLQIPIVQGRNFSAMYPSDSTRSVLVNEAFMKKAGWSDLNNRQVDFFYDSIRYNVIGVVKDHHYASLMQAIKPQLFITHPKYDFGELLIKIKPTVTSATLKHIEKVVKAQMPFLPYKYEFKDDLNRAQYAADEKWKQIISYAALLTIFISCIGLFGLSVLSAEKRTKEVGIRKVLGASVASIARTLTASFLKLVLLASVIAFPAAWWALSKWLQNYPYRIQISPWIFAAATAIVLLVAICTISFQAIRSAIANPVKSLKSE